LLRYESTIHIFKINPIVAKAMKLSYSRQQGCSCSRLPQNLDNEEDEGSMAFPKGKIFYATLGKERF